MSNKRVGTSARMSKLKLFITFKYICRNIYLYTHLYTSKDTTEYVISVLTLVVLLL